MADPRVVNGFKPMLKEMTYQIVVERSKGSHLWDLDGNEYVDALNGFGMSLFGWQPGFVLDAVREQLELGYEIGPQHPLAGDVTRLVCDVTGHDRAALCNTGSERSEEHTSELQSLMRISYAVFCLKTHKQRHIIT